MCVADMSPEKKGDRSTLRETVCSIHGNQSSIVTVLTSSTSSSAGSQILIPSALKRDLGKGDTFIFKLDQFTFEHDNVDLKRHTKNWGRKKRGSPS